MSGGVGKGGGGGGGLKIMSEGAIYQIFLYDTDVMDIYPTTILSPHIFYSRIITPPGHGIKNTPE